MVDKLRSLEKAALEHNLDLRAAAFVARVGEEALEKSYGLYDPQGRVLIGVDRQKLPEGLLARTESRFETRRIDFSLTQKLPSGAELILSFENRRQDPDAEGAENASYNSGLNFTLIQPLLQGFGRTVTEQGILLAGHDRQVSFDKLLEHAVDILTAVRNAYFEVLRYRDELRLRDSSLSLADKVLEETRAKVAAGVFPPIEVLEAEVGLARRQQEQLDTSKVYQDALDTLSLLLGSGQNAAVSDEALIQQKMKLNEEAGYQLALQTRPDLLLRLEEIDKTRLEIQLARNEMLPQLDFSMAYGRLGHADDYHASLNGLARQNFDNWGFAVSLSYPLGNREARHEYQRIHYKLKSQQAHLARIHQEARKEIRGAIRKVEMSDKRIDVTGKSRILAKQKLENLLERHKVGLVTTRDVLEGEEDLAKARTEQIASLVEYNKASTEYLRVTGQLLDSEKTELIGRLYRDNVFARF